MKTNKDTQRRTVLGLYLLARGVFKDTNGNCIDKDKFYIMLYSKRDDKWAILPKSPLDDVAMN